MIVTLIFRFIQIHKFNLFQKKLFAAVLRIVGSTLQSMNEIVYLENSSIILKGFTP